MGMSVLGEAVVSELRIVEGAAHRLARARAVQRHVKSGWDALMDYWHTAHREVEQLRMLFPDRKIVLIADEEQARGTVDHVPVHPRELVLRALESNASAMIVVHNHPSAPPRQLTATLPRPPRSTAPPRRWASPCTTI